MNDSPDHDRTEPSRETRPGRRPHASTGFRWYGPTLLLLLATIGVMLVGPGVIRSVAHARTNAELVSVRNDLGSNPSLVALSEAFKDVARAVEPSVVHVEIQSRSQTTGRDARPGSPLEGLPDGLIPPELRKRFERPEEPETPAPAQQFSEFNDFRPVGNGSGWVYHFRGGETNAAGEAQPAGNYIITNAHVVREVGETERIRVTLFDRTVATAEVVGRPDHATDVAVLRLVEGEDTDVLHPAVTGTEEVEQGEIAFAFGSPFGAAFSFSMSQGIVSAVGRQVGIIGGDSYENFIQTDAAINPGNSGGPLVNVRGEIIGMNTAIATSNRGIGGAAANSGVGFAIPVKMAARIADRIIVDGVVRRGFLGVAISDLTSDLAQSFGFEGRGVLVNDVMTDGAARAAGLKPGDIITAVDGEAVANSSALRLAIANRKPGKTVAIEVFRSGEKQTFDVQLGSRDGAPLAMSGGNEAPEEAGPGAVSDLALRYGITGLKDIEPDTQAQVPLPGRAGVLITGIRPGSVAAGPRVALRPMDTVITAVMDKQVTSAEDFATALAAFDADKPIRLTVLRRDPTDPQAFQQSFVLLKLP